MPTVTLYNTNGDEVEEIEVRADVFAVPLKRRALHQTAVVQAARKRLGTAATRDRGEVRGGSAKPWPQKGTGRARHGSTVSPIWTGGGVAFGPHPRDYSPKVPKKVRRLALKSLLSDKIKKEKLVLVDTFGVDEPKTKHMAALLANLKITGGALVVLDEVDLNVIKAARNLPRVKTVLARQLNVLDLLNHNYVLMNKAALRQVEEVFGG